MIVQYSEIAVASNKM